MKPSLPAEWAAHDRKIKPYVWSHRFFSWSRKLLGLALLFVLGYGGTESLGYRAQNALTAAGYSPLVRLLLFFAGLGLIWEILSLPFAYFGYRVECRFGLSRQNVGSWAKDHAKGLALGAVFGALALGLIYGCVVFCGSLWWLACATAFTLLSIGLAQLAPILLIPLFLKMEPMTPGPLKDRLLGLCARFEIKVKEVYRLGLGEKTEKGNAAFMGLGRTKRIVIGDTIYEKYLPEEVEAVFAHELGHQVHGDLWRAIGLSTVLLFLVFYGGDRLVQNWWPSSPAEPMGLLLFFLAVSVLQIPIGVLQVAHSRQRERAADRFAATTVKVAAPLADALEKLTYQNWGFFKPNPMLEWWTYSHPAPWRRIVTLRA